MKKDIDIPQPDSWLYEEILERAFNNDSDYFNETLNEAAEIARTLLKKNATDLYIRSMKFKTSCYPDEVIWCVVWILLKTQQQPIQSKLVKNNINTIEEYINKKGKGVFQHFRIIITKLEKFKKQPPIPIEKKEPIPVTVSEGMGAILKYMQILQKKVVELEQENCEKNKALELSIERIKSNDEKIDKVEKRIANLNEKIHSQDFIDNIGQDYFRKLIDEYIKPYEESDDQEERKRIYNELWNFISSADEIPKDIKERIKKLRQPLKKKQPSKSVQGDNNGIIAESINMGLSKESEEKLVDGLLNKKQLGDGNRD